MASEFHSLAETLLNHESAGRTTWGNLGYWREAHTYPEACTALADQLGAPMELSPGDRLIDLGFGCGDQLLHWHARYGVSWMAGLNLSDSQTGLARTRLRDSGVPTLIETADRLCVGSAGKLRRWAADQGHADIDAILALDCAYHFENRLSVMHEAAALLVPGGRLGITDLHLLRSPKGLLEHAALKLLSRLARIPGRNLVDVATYRSQWRQAGFELIHEADIHADVFRPFGVWLRRYRAALPVEVEARGDWGKYEGTARFMDWVERRGLMGYGVWVGRRMR